MVREGGSALDHHVIALHDWLETMAVSQHVGHIRFLSGAVFGKRGSAAAVALQISDPLLQGDAIETGADGRASIVLSDGTVFNLAPFSRVVLDELVQRSDRSLASAQLSVSQGTFAVYAGHLGKTANLSINTPSGLIRGIKGGAVLSLSVATFMFVLIKELHADVRDVGLLLDDIIKYTDLEHGSFEIVTKEAVPRVLMVDNPEVMVVMQPTPTGFSIQQVTVSSVQMAEMLAASDEAFATYRLAQADPFTTGSIKKASGGGGFFDPFADVQLTSSANTPLALQGNDTSLASDFTAIQAPFVPPSARVPTPGTAVAAVDDDGLAAGNPASVAGDLNANLLGGVNLSEAVFTGVLGGSLGLDGAGANGFSFAPGLNGAMATVGLETVVYSLAGNELTAKVSTGERIGSALFTAKITDPTTGAYTVTLHENVLHAGGPNGEGADAVVMLGYIITDADGSSVNGSFLNIVFNDDAPSATDHAIQTIAEGLSITGTLSFVAGADGATVTHLNGTVLSFGADGYSQQIDIGPGLLKVKADGSYSFAADAVTLSPVPLALATLTVTDGDGDTATATVSFQVIDANTPTPPGRDPQGAPGQGAASAAVDDDGLPGGNPASTTGDLDANLAGDTNPSEAVFSGVLGGSVGLDGAGANGFSFAPQLNGATVTVGLETATLSVVGNLLTATVKDGARAGTELFEVEITNPATGAYTVTLVNSVLQAGDPNQEATDATVSFEYVITDADGSAATGSILTITFNDDVPTAHADANSVIEGGVVGGNVLTGAGADVFGADGPVATTPAGGVVGVKAGNDTSSAVTTGVGTQISGAYGKLTLNADGSYSYDGNPDMVPPLGATDVFVYTIKDGDGDTSTATLTITLTDSGIAAPNDSDVTVEEKALDTTITLPDLASGTVVGSLPGLATETDASSNQVNATSSVAIVSYELVSGGNNPTAGTYGTIKVNTDGSYVYTLTKNYLNPTADDGVQTLSGLESFQYRATDANGNTAFGFITVNIVDDVPTFTHITNAIIANADNNILVGLHNLTFGADGEQSIEITPLTSIAGLSYLAPVHNADGSVELKAQVGGADFFDLTINPDGTYTFNLIESRPTTSQTFGFGGLAGGQGTNEFTLGDATFHSVGDVLKPTSNGFGVDDGNLDTGDQFLITFSSVDIDKLSFLAEHEGSADFIMTWTTNTGETGTVSTSVNGTLAIDPIGDFTSMSFEVTGGKAKFDNFSYTKPVLPADQTLQFSIYGVDGDGDHSATQTLSITLLGAQAPNKPIMGTGGNETIKGTADADTLNGDNGSDVLNGGAGDDTLAGGNGADLFVVDGHSSAPNVGAGGTDTIEDFFASDGDQILVDVADLSSTIASALSISVDQFDFGDILTDPTAWNGNANQFYYDTSHQELWYSADGWGADKIDLAHMATGVTPADVQGGIKIF